MDSNWKPETAWNIKDPNLAKLLSSGPSKPPAVDTRGSAIKAGSKGVLTKDLTTQMAERLRKVEQINTAQRKELKEKTERIERLEKEVAQLRAAVSPEVAVEFQRVHEEKDRFRRKTEEMEKFLLKYGLRWVGEQPEGELDVATMQQDLSGQEPRYKFQLPNEIDIRVIQRRVTELNIIAEQDAQRWVPDGKVRKLKTPESVAILFYQNGLILQGFQFKPYSSHEAQSILSDILEGYFPHDLKRKYPDGVPMKVVDYTDQQFTGQEQKVFGVHDAKTGLKSADEFLADLPESVIRDGQIIPVRAGIEKILKPKAEEPIELTSGTQTQEDRTTTLRIKTESGKKTLIIKMSYDDTLADLKRVLDPQRETRGECVLMCSFPSKTFEWGARETLEQLGLIPNYALMLRSL
mmetsp:Transcript_26762/g.48241  ORF Transcript_26762/g.48241 Transcript_26762/m.48241 type:complete len:407 (-) Transcript_26762:22-1242(-)